MTSVKRSLNGGLKSFDDVTVRRQVAAILASPSFARAPRMQRFLSFLVEETLAGRAANIKEYAIATQVFEKDESFEPGTSAVVRVEAGRLRRLLTQYHVEHGQADEVVIDVPKGSYRPRFSPTVDRSKDEVHDRRSGPSLTERGPTRWPIPDERRSVTVLSCSLGEGHGTLGNSNADDFIRGLSHFYKQATAIAQAHGGRTDALSADRLIVYFGWPSALEDSAGRALTAALDIVDAVQGNPHCCGYGARIGIASSDVVARSPAVGGTLDPHVIGEAPVMATKILSHSPSNGILIADTTRRRVGNAFKFLPAGNFDGVAGRPCLLWRVVRAMSDQTRFRAAHGEVDLPMIGRREELALLANRWQLSREGEGQCVILVGEAGIGKSRLAEALVDMATCDGAVIRLQCSSHHTNSTLYPFIRQLRLLLASANSGEIENLDPLVSLLAQFELNKPFDRSILGTLLSIHVGDDLPLVPPNSARTLTLKFLERLLLAHARRQPTLVLIEDIHWADPTTLEFMRDLFVSRNNAGLFVVATSRQIPENLVRVSETAAAITLTRLPKKQCMTLIDRIAGSLHLSVQTRATILERADGVPLFLEELTKLCLAICPRGSYVPRIPESLDDLLASQLDRLGSSRTVAQLASVIGQMFTREVLLSLKVFTEDEIDFSLEQLLAAGVVVKSARDGGGVSFRHALLRDAAYESIPTETRQEWHFQIAQLFIRSFPDLVAAQPELVARHLTDAGKHDAAFPYWVKAGRKATARYALTEAIADFRLALECVGKLPTLPGKQEHELVILTDLVLAIRVARGYGDPELQELYARALPLSKGLGRTEEFAQILFGLWTYAAGRGNWAEAASIAREFLVLAERKPADGQLQVEASRLLGAVALFRGNFSAARDTLEQALQRYDPQSHAPRFGYDPGVVSAIYLAWAKWHLGLCNEAEQAARRALHIATTRDHPPTLAFVLAWLIFFETCRRDFDAVIGYNQQLARICDEHDFRHWRSFGTACAEWAAGRQDGDVRHVEQLLAAKDDFCQSWGGLLSPCLLLLAADLCRMSGQRQRGLGLTSVALERMNSQDEKIWLSEGHRLTGDLMIVSGSPGNREAEKHAMEALTIARRQNARLFENSAQELISRLGVL